MDKSNWTKKNWRNYPITQQPPWQDKKVLNRVISELEKLPALVFSGETRSLLTKIKEVNKKKKFILQVGNCAESFSDCNGPKIHNFLRIVLQMAMIINYKSKLDVIKIGRIAGQYAKPRSSDYEIINGERIPAYRGDNINSYEPINDLRNPNPERLKEGYFRSAATLNLIRAFIQGGYSDIENINDWKEHFFEKDINKLEYYQKLMKDISNSLENQKDILNSLSNQIYTSHEGLILDFEEAFTRLDTVAGGYYDTSAHFIWIGERTRHFDGAHVEFARGIGNPLGIKIGPEFKSEEIINVIKRLNPDNKPGRITLIPRMGKDKIHERLPSLIDEVKYSGLDVTWICDPMHGNTFKHNGYKIRAFDDIVSEINSFFAISNDKNVVPGGVHLEITDENVTECVGGINGLGFKEISRNYATKVDPRLNAAQALELAIIIGDLLENNK